MFQIFRPLTRYWVTKIFWFLLWVIVAGYLSLVQHTWVALWPAVFAIMSLFGLHGLWRREIILNESELSARFGKEETRIAWKDIVVAKLTTGMKNKQLLELSTQQGSFYISLESLDTSLLWQWIQRYVSPEALESNAHERLLSHQKWLEKVDRLVKHTLEPLCASYSLQAKFNMGLLLIIMTSFGLLLAGLGLIETVLCFGPLTLFAGWLLFLSITYRLEMTSEAITVIKLWRRRTMKWDEIGCIEHDFGWHRWIVLGNDKRLAVVGLQTLGGEDRPEMMDMLKAQIEHRNIKLSHKERALFVRSHNVSPT
jgi:hypothetical protein